MPVLYTINLIPVNFLVKCSTKLADTTQLLVAVTDASGLGQ